MSKTWITTEIVTDADQLISIQPTPEFDGIEFFFSEGDKTYQSGTLYINKEELPLIIERLNDMMNYVTKKQ